MDVLFLSIPDTGGYRLQRSKQLKRYELVDNHYLCPLDGTQVFSSNQLECEHCLHQLHGDTTTTYSHKVLQAAIVHPDSRQVIPLMPEEIRNEDGNTKQDCETNAAKRLLKKLRCQHRQLKLIITGDSLYAKQPMIYP